MLSKLFRILLTSSTFFLLLQSQTAKATIRIGEFTCNSTKRGTIATVTTALGNIDLINWQENYWRISNRYDPGTICEEVSRRMEKYQRMGRLNYLSVAKFNRTYFICASDRNGTCIERDFGLLFTVESERNPEIILQELFGDIPDSAIVKEDRLVIDFNRLLESKLAKKNNLENRDNRDNLENRYAPINTNSIRYRCVQKKGTPITIAETNRGTIELIIWKSNFFSASGYTPRYRCSIVSQRFQQQSNAKNLKYISYGIMNRQPIICVSDRVGNCQPNGLLLTLEPRDNAEPVLSELFNYQRPVTRGRRQNYKTVIPIDRVLQQRQTVN